MILHTIMPIDFVLKDMSTPDTRQYVEQNGEFFEGVKNEQGFIINRVISTNPATYLNSEFSPGKTLKKY